LRFIFIVNNHFIRSTTIGFVLSHWTILGVGIWVEVDRVSLLGILENTEDAPPELAQLANIGYVLIGVGAFLMLMGFLGCCRAVKGSKCMLVSFFSIMLIIFLVEVAAVIVLFGFEPLVRADALHHNKKYRVMINYIKNHNDLLYLYKNTYYIHMCLIL
uniref:Tetraspanin 34 n=1 Tax=Cyprinus carpio TaxID=7962 RepID=A0A8C1PAZ0_CYPCA